MLEFIKPFRQSIFQKDIMRVIKSETGFLLYLKIFKQLAAYQTKIILWQISPDSGGRQISETHVNSFNLETKKVFFELSGAGLLRQQLPIYGYIEDGALIFKTFIEDIRDKTLCLKVPDEISLLEENEMSEMDRKIAQGTSDVWKVKRLDTNLDNQAPDILRVKSMAQRSTRDQDLLNQEFGLSVDEEDKLFADKRESPRARPKIDKYVKILRTLGEAPLIYKLFDLSRGGMGFLCALEDEFIKGSNVNIVGFNDFDLDDPLVGQVMSIRSLDGASNEFKVGVKFSEGQD